MKSIMVKTEELLQYAVANNWPILNWVRVKNKAGPIMFQIPDIL